MNQKWSLIVVAIVTSVHCAALPIGAARVTDSSGDFLPTWSVPAGVPADYPYLDITSAEIILDTAGETLTFEATVNGEIPPFNTPNLPDANAFYIWGINRGGGTERFVGGSPSIGGGVAFDSVLVINRDGSGAVNDFLPTQTSTALPAGTAQIDGNSVSVTLPISLFPSEGPGNFLSESYLWNFWPRWAGTNAGVPDFAPNDVPGATNPNAGNAPVTVVPEPSAMTLTGIAMTLAGSFCRRSIRSRRPTVN